MKNKLEDLNNILFEQLERLQDDELTQEEFEREIQRTDRVNKISQTIINNAALALKAIKDASEIGINTSIEVPLLGISNE